MDAEQARALRAPFPPEDVDRKPQPYKKDSAKGRCPECEGWHGLPALHLDYVGHAAATDRLLSVDPSWSWEPVPNPASLGLPCAPGGMWIRLTVCGVTRLGYGDADGKTGGNAVKETIGDAIRNAGMRFGVGLDLWRREDKGRRQVEDEQSEAERPQVPPTPVDERPALKAEIARVGKAMGLSQESLAEQFAAHNGGLWISDGSQQQLSGFLAGLRQAAWQQEQQRKTGVAS